MTSEGEGVPLICLSSYHYICVLTLLHVCVLILLYVCVLILLYVSSYYYMYVSSYYCMCPHTTVYMPPYTTMCATQVCSRYRSPLIRVLKKMQKKSASSYYNIFVSSYGVLPLSIASYTCPKRKCKKKMPPHTTIYLRPHTVCSRYRSPLICFLIFFFCEKCKKKMPPHTTI
jgi:hypothetical protein